MVGTSTTNNNALNHTSATTTPKPSIPSLEETTSYIDFPSNHWGYYAIPMNKANTINNTNTNNDTNTNNNTNNTTNNNGGSTNTDNTNTINPTAPETDYNPLPLPIGLDPDDPTKTGHKINEKDRMATNDTTNVNFATKIDTGQPSGTYNNTVLYTAITNAPPQPITYLVHYDKNGGQNVPQDQEYTTLDPTKTSHEFQLKDPPKEDIPFRPGYTFGGWTAVQPDPDKNINNQAGAYSPGSQIYLTNAKPEVTLYAIWIPNSEIGFNNSGITTMQQMTPEICNAAPMYTEGRLQDTRDYKVYSVVKLRTTKDSDEGGQCWMNQNLSLDIRADKEYTSADTNVDPNNPWRPGESQSVSKNTIPNGKLNSSTWKSDTLHPYSYNPADSYFQPAIPLTTDNEQETISGDTHYTTGNYYNWSAAKASNDTSGQTSIATSGTYNICPKGWGLPTYSGNEFKKMFYAQGITISVSTSSGTYTTDGFNIIRSDPVYWVRNGYVYNEKLNNPGSRSYYWSSTTRNSGGAYLAAFTRSMAHYYDDNRGYGSSVRCIAQNIASPTPDPTPSGGGGDTTNNIVNMVYNPYSSTTDNTNNNDAEESSNGYSNPQGVDQYGRPLSTTTSGPNWLLFILLLVLSLLTLGVVLYLFLYKHHSKKN